MGKTIKKEMLERIAELYIENRVALQKHKESIKETGNLKSALDYECTKSALFAKERLAYSLLDEEEDLELDYKEDSLLKKIDLNVTKMNRSTSYKDIVEYEIAIAVEKARLEMIQELIKLEKEL